MCSVTVHRAQICIKVKKKRERTKTLDHILNDYVSRLIVDE